MNYPTLASLHLLQALDELGILEQFFKFRIHRSLGIFVGLHVSPFVPT